jgi:hypothetical protein
VYDEKRGVQLIPGLGNAVPLDVNNRGDMVGNGIFDGRQGSFVYRGGAVTVLDHPPGVSVTVVRGVSDRGVMVGNAQIGTGSKSVSNLIVYSPDGEIEYLGTLDGVGATGLRINQRGDIIGWTWGDDGRPRGFVRNGDVTTYIEVPESAHAIFPRAINDRGDVVLDAQLLDGSRTIFIWSGGSLRDVSDAVDETGWQLTEVHAINNSGEIAARGFFEGQEYALLLVPHRH